MNYNEKWNRQYMMSSKQGKNHYEDKGNAMAYDCSNNIRVDGEMRAQSFELQPHWSAIDIGSGPGTLTIPLARRLKKVTAVEPSAAMIECLLKHKKEENLNNIDIIHNKWENVNINKIGKYDIVIASYSLNMKNIKDALLKMNNAANERVYLYWFAGNPSWEQINLDLYPLIKKEEYITFPKCNIIYNVLYDLGIYPDVTVLNDTFFNREFDDINLAIDDLKKRLGINSNEYNSILTDYINKNYIFEEDKIIFVDNTNYVRMSWSPIIL